jgi:YHS domain-containing protein
MRLLIFAILAYLLYRVGKAVFRSSKEIDRGKNGEVFDEMVQDPFCKTYIPRRESVKRVMEGKEYFLCKDCADRFEQEGKG